MCSGDHDLFGALWRINVFDTGEELRPYLNGSLLGLNRELCCQVMQALLSIYGCSFFCSGRPPVSWEKAKTSVNIGDVGSVMDCEVSFAFAFDKGVVLKDTKANGCKSMFLIGAYIVYNYTYFYLNISTPPQKHKTSNLDFITYT